MSWRAVGWGILTGLGVVFFTMVLVGVLIYGWPWELSRRPLALAAFFAAPFAAGFTSGILCPYDGIRHGLAASVWGWAVCLVAAMWFFYPYLDAYIVVLSFFACSFFGAAGGASGINWRAVHRPAKPKT